MPSHNHPPTPIIKVENLSFSYNKITPVLKDITLSIFPGDFVGLIGPNGGGKSTLLKLILNLLPLQQGTIQLFGENLSSFHDWQHIGYVSQKASHFDRQFPITVGEVVAMGLFSQKKPFRSLTSKDQILIRQALEDVNMLEFKNTPLNELSGGQQQRIFIARALTSNPCLLALDEPTVGVDIKSQEKFYSLLQKLRREKNLTIILVSHDIEIISSQVNSFACLNQTLVYHGLPEKFSSHENFEKIYGHNLRYIPHNH